MAVRSFKEIRRQREEEEDSGLRGADGRPQTEAQYTENLEEMLNRVGPMLEQLNNLYRQYLQGVEKRPPIERRKQLDQLMNTLELMQKPTSQHRFLFNNLLARYGVEKTRWDKMVRAIENGQVKRVK